MLRVVDNVLPELAAQMAVEIEERAAGPSYGSRNVGGWKSREDLFEWRGALAIYALRSELVVHHLDRLVDGTRRLVGWAMINRGGSYHARHNHGGMLAGIYYVTTGETRAPTIFELADKGVSRSESGLAIGPVGHSVKVERAIDPIPGRLVVFSPSIWHRVPKVPGEQPRITIAFEVRA